MRAADCWAGRAPDVYKHVLSRRRCCGVVCWTRGGWLAAEATAHTARDTFAPDSGRRNLQLEACWRVRCGERVGTGSAAEARGARKEGTRKRGSALSSPLRLQDLVLLWRGRREAGCWPLDRRSLAISDRRVRRLSSTEREGRERRERAALGAGGRRGVISCAGQLRAFHQGGACTRQSRAAAAAAALRRASFARAAVCSSRRSALERGPFCLLAGDAFECDATGPRTRSATSWQRADHLAARRLGRFGAGHAQRADGQGHAAADWQQRPRCAACRRLITDSAPTPSSPVFRLRGALASLDARPPAARAQLHRRGHSARRAHPPSACPGVPLPRAGVPSLMPCLRASKSCFLQAVRAKTLSS